MRASGTLACEMSLERGVNEAAAVTIPGGKKRNLQFKNRN